MWMEQLKCKGLAPSVPTFNSLLNACARASELDRAERWFAEMRAAGGKVKPDTVSYSTMINAFSKLHRAAEADRWLQEMCSDEGLQDEPASSFCYGTVVQAFSRAGNLERARELVDEMMAKRILIDANCLGAIIPAYIRAD